MKGQSDPSAVRYAYFLLFTGSPPINFQINYQNFFFFFFLERGGQFSIVHENGRQWDILVLCKYYFISDRLFLPKLQAITSTAVKKGGLSTGDVGAVYKYKNTVIDVKVDTESNVG